MNDPVNWIDPSGLSGNLIVNGHEISHTTYRDGAMYGSIRDFAYAVGGTITNIYRKDSNGIFPGFGVTIGNRTFNVFMDGGSGSNISHTTIDCPVNPVYVRIIANLQTLVDAAGSSVTSLGYNVGTRGGTFRPTTDSRTSYYIVGEAQAAAVAIGMTNSMAKWAYDMNGKYAKNIVMFQMTAIYAGIFLSAIDEGVSLFVTTARAGISIFGVQTDIFSTKTDLVGHVSRINGQNVFELQNRNVGVFFYGQLSGFKPA